MIEIYLRILIIKILFFIFIKPPLFMRFGRHSTTKCSYKYYTISKQLKQSNKANYFKKIYK